MKDAQGHGSAGRGATGAAGMRLKKTYTSGPHSAKVYGNPEYGEHVVKFFRDGNYQPNADYHTDDKDDAHSTAQAQLARYGSSDTLGQMGNKLSQDVAAGRMLASGLKSDAVPIHDSMPRSNAGVDVVREASNYGSNRYSKTAVDKAIASSNRSGRRISGGEASRIHALLKGRH